MEIKMAIYDLGYNTNMIRFSITKEGPYGIVLIGLQDMIKTLSGGVERERERVETHIFIKLVLEHSFRQG